MKFKILLLNEILKNLTNNYSDNYNYLDHQSTGDKKQSTGQFSKTFIHRLFNFIKTNRHYFMGKYSGGFNYLYNMLDNKESKDLLIKILAYRILGPHRVKLLLDNPWYWEKMGEIDKYFSDDDKIKIDNNFELKRINLEKIGYPIDMYYESVGAMTEFVIRQYEYKTIKASEGDFVIDAGACWGDTALFFANKVGEHGKVFSFEFIPTNLKVFRKNIGLNADLKDRIEIVENPLWSESKKTMYYLDSGPSSRISFKNENNYYSGKTNTVSIDDYVTQNKIPRVDFIKMDIEGAELEALKGSVETIKKFKPKLAICLYHNLNDFINIPYYLSKLDPGYKFYLKHSSVSHYETVLFATEQIK